MPELPDITIYLESLQSRVVGRVLEKVRIRSPFLLRTFDPPIESLHGKAVRELRRSGKRIVFGYEDDLWLILHLMVAGRLHWKEPAPKVPGKNALAAFDFPRGSLTLTEAGTKHRASLHLVRGEPALREHDPGGVDVFAVSLDDFTSALRRENHTLKRILTDPHLFSGIGNAYSDEILHRARISPLAQSRKISEAEIERLFHAVREVLSEWVERLRAETGDKFPEKVTAFRPEMAVHGRYNEPCPVCKAPVQRIRYADNETNYWRGVRREGRSSRIDRSRGC